MKVFGFVLSAAAMVSACSATPPAPADLEVAFACTNGESISVRFSPAQSTAVLVRNGDSIELPQQPSGSGFIYSNGPNTIRGKGDDLTVEIGRMVPIQCKAKRTQT
jgi:membrane-bound inhibitor of C-type lysozyme